MHHIRFNTFSFEYILCVQPTPKTKKKKKSMIKLKLEKNNFISSFLTCIHYQHSGLSHPLMVKLLPFLPIMLCSHCFHMYKHTSHALAAWRSCLSLWSVRYSRFCLLRFIFSGKCSPDLPNYLSGRSELRLLCSADAQIPPASSNGPECSVFL